jgi:predicted nucleic acid-binding protein
LAQALGLTVALFLDTSVVIDMLRGADFAPALIQREPLLVSPVTIDEVLFGMRPAEERMTLELFEGLLVVSMGSAEGRMSGGWRREYAKRGITLTVEDTLIAAGAVTHGVPLATGNVKHFPMRELRVEEWPPPPV